MRGRGQHCSDLAEQALNVDWLGIEIGAAYFDALVAIASKRMGRQGNDRNG